MILHCENEMKCHFIEFMKKLNKILKFGFAYTLLQVLRYVKKFQINFLKTKWWQRISRKQICFFGGWTTTGRNFFRKQLFLLKLIPFFKKSKFRKNPTILSSFLYIFLESSSFLVLGAKLVSVFF